MMLLFQPGPMSILGTASPSQSQSSALDLHAEHHQTCPLQSTKGLFVVQHGMSAVIIKQSNHSQLAQACLPREGNRAALTLLLGRP